MVLEPVHTSLRSLHRRLSFRRRNVVRWRLRRIRQRYTQLPVLLLDQRHYLQL
jgi:hypothetical protein